MANPSFDITTGVDLQEVDNAVNQTQKELRQRFDFRSVDFEIDFKRGENAIVLTTEDEFKLNAIWDLLQTKLVKRKVPVKNLHPSDVETVGGGKARMNIALQQGIPGDTAKEIVKFIKDKKLKKVQAAIQADQVRVSAPKRDSLQEVMGLLRAEDFGIELQFGNYRGT
jgi:cyclic-di-GMP-binding protein